MASASNILHRASGLPAALAGLIVGSDAAALSATNDNFFVHQATDLLEKTSLSHHILQDNG